MSTSQAAAVADDNGNIYLKDLNAFATQRTTKPKTHTHTVNTGSHKICATGTTKNNAE